MRRALALSALFGTAVAGLGCTHIAGKNDCTYSPADAVLPVPSNPYHPTAAFPHGPVPPAVAGKSETGIQPPDKAKDGPAPAVAPKVEPAVKPIDPVPMPMVDPAPKADPAPKVEPKPKLDPMAPMSIPQLKVEAAPVPVVPMLPALKPGL